ARHPDTLLPTRHTVRHVYVRNRRTDEAKPAARVAAVGVLGLLPGICDQGPDVPVPHVAAGCARGSAHRGLRDPGQRSAEDGDLRIYPLLAAAAAASLHG